MYERWAYRHAVAEKEAQKTKDLLKLAAMLHDVGKVTTPVWVMDKSTKLETIIDRIELKERNAGGHRETPCAATSSCRPCLYLRRQSYAPKR